jgi:hypothetical protein
MPVDAMEIGTATEVKTCETCGRLFVREVHPQKFVASLGRSIEIPRMSSCRDCVLHPPSEDEQVVVHRSYRVVGIRMSF